MARWKFCNLLQIGPDARRLWQFEAKGANVVGGREQRVANGEPIPPRVVSKTWSALWQPRLNVAWLPSENVFFRVLELPRSNPDELRAMLELQLEKISPIPVTQIVWTYHIMSKSASDSLVTLVVVIASRSWVEEFLGHLEQDGFLSDLLDVLMVDQLEALSGAGDGAWIIPLAMEGGGKALVSWWQVGVLRGINLVNLPPGAGRAMELKNQLTHMVWSGELEGWIAAPVQWHVISDPVTAAEWQGWLREGFNEPVSVVAATPLADLAAGTARRAIAPNGAPLLPPEHTARYHQQFVDRLWLHGLGYAGLLYAISLVIYFCAVAVLEYRTTGVETQVAGLAPAYTNSLQLTAQFNVLSERQELKFAALDCWNQVAQQLPATLTLQRFSLADGRHLTLSGTTSQDQVDTLFNFYSTLQKLQRNGQFIFDQQKGTPPSPRLTGNSETWNFSLDLLNAEAEP